MPYCETASSVFPCLSLQGAYTDQAQNPLRPLLLRRFWQAPYGYILDSTPVYFDITAEKISEENGVTIVKAEKKNTSQKGTITVEKSGEIFSNVTAIGGGYTDENGNDVSLEYDKAVAVALSKIQNEEIDLVILQSRSPTCGVNQIYDGSFTGKLVSGMGLFAKALKQRGYNVIDVEEI